MNIQAHTRTHNNLPHKANLALSPDGNSMNFNFVVLLKCDLILETDQDVTFGISRNTDFKYSSHCSSLVQDCSHARYTV